MMIPAYALLFSCKSSEKAMDDVSAESFTDPEDTQDNEDSDRSSVADSLRNEIKKQYKIDLYNEYQARANGLTTFYILAQQRYYNGDYEQALYYINKAYGFKENADILALRGSIFLGLGSVDNFVRDWRKALELDENLPLSYSNYVLRELQNQGLLDDKFRKNF
tara:strand:- start:256294 stop:256785 length:492 start_codon:yes stop_codon:yes gene_type:complete